ncbi:lasso peptide biosynthesis B2 protein [Granulicella sp. WH15]|uniref:lasso peptide biosynthesis B2 protein n=1 Tax=Granulicella sp. WH15 TaxID=2602070 RepID=UPI001367686B|nr:lasso peptide biosynthesis B2 protein [Granulicella sp. WH15]QHN02738.1 lasso peptide biosynthesis B2 protein [Granulicella sp. WH15]
MPIENDLGTDMEPFRLVLVVPESKEILVTRNAGEYKLPLCLVPKWERVAASLQQAIFDTWDIKSYLIDLLPGLSSFPDCAVAEILSLPQHNRMVRIRLEQLDDSELSPQQRESIIALFNGDQKERGPLYRIGWLHDAIRWIQDETGQTVSLPAGIRQFNAGNKSTLLRFSTNEGKVYWLKALSGEGETELAITQLLASKNPEALPPLIAAHQQWSAWLMEDFGEPISLEPGLTELKQAVAVMAKLQFDSTKYTNELLQAGALDRSPAFMHGRCSELFSYVAEAMSKQRSTRLPQLSVERISYLDTMVQEACLRMNDLRIPNGVVHGNINRGNILFDGLRCRITDWQETYVGNPLVALQHLILRSPAETRPSIESDLKSYYKIIWAPLVPSSRMDVAFALMPLVAAVTALYGKGDWLHSERRNEDGYLRYARSIVRHIDRSVELQEVKDALSNSAISVSPLSTQCDGSRPDAYPSSEFPLVSAAEPHDTAVVEIAASSPARESISSLRLMHKAELVCEAYCFLLFIDLVMHIGGAKLVYRTMGAFRSVAPIKKRASVSSELCFAVDMACVLYVKRVRCLQHSAALALLLRTYGWDADLVVGGRLFPTDFHAWVQIGPSVINDRNYVVSSYLVLERC